MKRYLVSASEMKRYDQNTTDIFKVPSLLLMERAALVTVEELQRERGKRPCKVLIAAGQGNNGGDGLAVGRLLMQQGYQVTFVQIGDPAKQSEQTRQQREILEAYWACFYDRIEGSEYAIIIDALFGVGLSRNPEGIYAQTIHTINAIREKAHAYVCSIDIPSGIHSDTGAVMGCAVEADITVTYGFEKLGQILYPGAFLCGKLCCRDIGIQKESFAGMPPLWYCLEDAQDAPLQQRRADGNKGTFGKVLAIIGSSEICGAALLATKAVFRSGTGMVKVVTAAENRETLQQSVPEAMLLTYTEGETDSLEWREKLHRAFDWADCILIGPGIGTAQDAERLLQDSILNSDLPLVADADALNLLAGKKVLIETLQKQRERAVVLTPHLGEFARLCKVTIPEVKKGLLSYPRKLAEELCCTIVCKDARTVVVSHDKREGYLNITGNSGMATAGSGDVLAGMIAGILAQSGEADRAAVSGVLLHGIAGDLAAAKRTETSMMATDLSDHIQDVFKLASQAKEEADVL